MKNLFIVLSLSMFLFNSTLLFGQSLLDTKEYIIEKIQANPPGESFVNQVLFNPDKSQINEYKGYTLTNDEFEHLFAYVITTYTDANKVHLSYSVGYIFDIRSISKILISKIGSTNAGDSYVMHIYLNQNYKAVKYMQTVYSNGGDRSNIEKVDIFLRYDLDVANKIKKAIIHLGELYNVNIKDGELF